MVCKQCGLETNVDGAVFCNGCGARLDGKKPCPHCAGLNDPSSAFCAFCGKRIDGKKVCVSCGAVHEGAFCPQCGASAQAKAPKIKPVKEKTEKGWWKKLLKWVGAGSAIAAATFAFIFLFFIGTETESSSLANSLLGGNVSSSTGIFGYFGSIYKDIETAIPMLESMEYETEQIVNLYITAGLGTLIAAATIICVTVFFILALVKFIRFAMGKSDASGLKFAALTVLAYLGGAAGIRAINEVMVELSEVSGYMSIELEMGEVLNGATCAGMALCLVFLLSSAATALVAHGKEWVKPAVIKKNAFIVGGLAFALIVFFMWQTMSVVMDTQLAESECEILASPLANSSMFLSMVEALDARVTGATVNADAEIAFVYIGSILAQLLMLGGIACAVGLVASRIRQIGGKEGTSMSWSIATLILSVLSLVAFVLVQVNMESILDAYMRGLSMSSGASISSLSNQYEIGVGSAIAVVVLSAVSLAISIVQKILCKEPAETPVEEIA